MKVLLGGVTVLAICGICLLFIFASNEKDNLKDYEDKE